MSKEKITGEGMVDGSSGAIVDGYYRIERSGESAPAEVQKLVGQLKDGARERAGDIPDGPARQRFLKWLDG